MGSKISRVQIELTESEIERIASTYHAWRGTTDADYNDVPGFCRGSDLTEIEVSGFNLSPGRHVTAVGCSHHGRKKGEHGLLPA
jgi:type I restriction enzyme M protein